MKLRPPLASPQVNARLGRVMPDTEAAFGMPLLQVYDERLQQSPDANSVDNPVVTITVDRCAHCAQGRGGGKNVFAFEQAGNAAAPDGQRSEHQGAVTDRLVAGHTDASGQGG